jgi:hypothetical protein
VRHAIADKDRRVARAAEQKALSAGNLDLIDFYRTQLGPCPTANPSDRQQRAMDAASLRAAMGR